MGLRINNNIEAFNAHRNLLLNSAKLSRSMERLSSGLRINRASDDAAGLAISERMRAQISGLSQAQRNAQDGISFVQTAEGSLQEAHSILTRIRDLAIQFNNGTYDAAGQFAISSEAGQLEDELNRIFSTAEFNGVPLLSQASGNDETLDLQIGPNAGDTLTITAIHAADSIGTAVSAWTGGAAPDLDAIDDAISAISAQRGMYGAVQNRLEHTISSLGVYQENLQAAESRIRDVDMAAEMTEFTRLQILQQSGTAMLAQANMLQSSVLSLLQ